MEKILLMGWLERRIFVYNVSHGNNSNFSYIPMTNEIEIKPNEYAHKLFNEMEGFCLIDNFA